MPTRASESSSQLPEPSCHHRNPTMAGFLSPIHLFLPSEGYKGPCLSIPLLSHAGEKLDGGRVGFTCGTIGADEAQGSAVLQPEDIAWHGFPLPCVPSSSAPSRMTHTICTPTSPPLAILQSVSNRVGLGAWVPSPCQDPASFHL